MGRLAGLKAVVTGGSSGIGRAITEAFAREGAEVLLTYRVSAEAAREVVQTIQAQGGQAEALQVDLRTRAACEALVREAHVRLGRLDVWVNNAGADILTTEAAGWDWERKLDLLLAVDLKGTMACCYAVAPLMQAQPEGGCILNMSWDHVLFGMAGENPQLFAAVKGAIFSFSKSLARALAPKVRVNVLAPGWIETRFGATVDPRFHRAVADSIPLRRWGRPEDVAAVAVFLASPEAAYLTGQAILINGGVI
ncbi:MAG: SDR family oxidoreductase [Acidobacteria bacterium]|nr:SDR family oxidoreductase [Acidobacteriota bacterium]MDW7983457.1 SDR family oxidoreductase [Acidobacteriota bacterium]